MENHVEETELHKVLTSFHGKFATLRAREELLSREITVQLPWHPLAELVVSLPRNQRRLCILWMVRNNLPWCVRVRLEEVFQDDKLSKFSDSLLQLKSDLRNSRWIRGRLPDVLERAFAEIQLYVRLDPKAAKRKVRRRGHRESNRTSIEERPILAARKQADHPGFGELPKQQQIWELQRQDLDRADQILAAEALGLPIPTAADWHNQRDYEAEKFGKAFWPNATDESLSYTAETREDTPVSLQGSEPCQGCKYAPRGSLFCAAGLLVCENGQKPILDQ
jgi:hypothetical protein